MRKLMLGCIGCLAITLLVLAPSAFAQSLGSCQLQGTASFSPGLSASAQPFSYSFTRQPHRLSIQPSGTPSTGTVGAGRTLTEQVKKLHHRRHRHSDLPGAGALRQRELRQQHDKRKRAHDVGRRHSDRGVVLDDGALAAVNLSGSVVASMTLTAVNAQPGDPTTYTITTNRFAGDSASGLLLFQPPDPTACNTPTGATTAAISGTVSLAGS